MSKEKLDFAVNSWYISPNRAANFLGSGILSSFGNPQGLERAAYFSGLTEEIVKWLRTHKIPSLGELIQQNNLKVGEYFTYYNAFYCRKQKIGNVPGRLMHCKLKELERMESLEAQFSDEHLTSTTAGVYLSGRQAHFLFGQIAKIDSNKVFVAPILIGSPIPYLFDASYLGQRWGTKMEVFIDLIDSFSLVKEIPFSSDLNLKTLKDISESEVKKAIAEILSEKDIPNDWGGERSDLFTTQVILDGNRISTAFALKGPAKFKPLTLAEMGKNGDQIDRLFTEPADLVIVQHCHNITPAVRGMMRAYATRIHNLKMFCLIDGNDTLRILKAYKKCGLS
ncbi:MAG: hypothetical protein KAR84_00400 [Elusimicrobiales bacterium]|nr:hypothetical protein [Elusimicrobiales bacterium]